MRPSVEFTKITCPENGKASVVPEDVSAFWEFRGGDEEMVVIQFVGGQTLSVKEGYETVKARLKGELTE